jgi:hypothetical protein
MTLVWSIRAVAGPDTPASSAWLNEGKELAGDFRIAKDC